MLARFSRWPFESDECSCTQDKIGLLTRLIDCYVELALIICDSQGQVLWANDYAVSAAKHWEIFNRVGNDLVVANDRLQQVIREGAASAVNSPEHKYFTQGHLFFEVSRLTIPEKQTDTRLIGLAIDCHALSDCGCHSLDELSPAEYRLIKCLECHHSLKESAKQMNISYENARTKLKHIFDKLNVHSQRELLAKVRHVVNQEDIC